MNKITTIIFIIIIIGISIFAFSRGGEGSIVITTEAQTEDGAGQNLGTLPDLVLTNLNGEEVSLTSFIGKPLVVNSWATWCPFCIKELPDFVTAQKEFGNDIIVIAINRSESQKKSQDYINENSIDGEIVFLLDGSDSFYRSIGGFTMPETIFVDETGIIRVHKRGFMQFSEIQEKITSILPTI